MSHLYYDEKYLRQKLLKARQKIGKNDSFNDAHDDTRPLGYWFQESEDGLILFVVFYTLACRWSVCMGCNLPSLSAQYPVSHFSLVRQIDNLFFEPEIRSNQEKITKLIVSNNGSVLDEVTFPTTALMYLLAQVNIRLPRLSIISFESRPEYVDVKKLDLLARAISERPSPIEVEIAVGFEAFDERVRNKIFRKGLSLRSFENLIERMKRCNFRLKCYFMQKPVPGMSDGEALEDIRRSINYLHDLSVKSGLCINLHLNPTYVAQGTQLERSFLAEEYSPPYLEDVARAVLCARGKSISLFIGLNDEGLAVPGGSFLRPGDEALVAELEAFNRSQNYDALEHWCRKHGLFT